MFSSCCLFRGEERGGGRTRREEEITPTSPRCLNMAATIVFIELLALPMSVVAKSQSSMSYGVAFQAMSSPQFWLSQFMISVILLLPVMANRFFWFDTHPSYADRLRMYKKSPKAARKEKIEVPLKFVFNIFFLLLFLL